MQQPTLQVLDHYQPKMGRFRPRFESKPEDYYELSNGDVGTACAACWAIVIAFFFIAVGFFVWSDRVGTSSMVLFCSILFCVFLPAFMLAAYLGSNNKMEVEERLIKKALAKITNAKQEKDRNRGGLPGIEQTLVTLNENELEIKIK